MALLAANASMMFVNLGKPTVVLVHLDQVKFPAIRNFSTSGESFYTYKGRLIIDAVSTFWLFFFIGKSFLALLTMSLIGGATVFGVAVVFGIIIVAMHKRQRGVIPKESDDVVV